MSLFLLNLRFDQQENSPHRYPNTDLLTVKCDHPEIRINSLVFLLKKNNYHPSLPIQKLCPWLQRNIWEGISAKTVPEQPKSKENWGDSRPPCQELFIYPSDFIPVMGRSSPLSVSSTGGKSVWYILSWSQQHPITVHSAKSTASSSWVTWVCQNHLKTDQKSCSMASWKPPTTRCPTWAKACSPDDLPFTLQVI